MFKLFIKNIPPRVFWLANILFWLVLNTIAADSAHRASVRNARPSVWIDWWLDYLPWWGNWALMAPLICAAVMSIESSKHALLKKILLHLISALVLMVFYWTLTLIEVILISNQGQLTFEEFQISVGRLLLSPMHMDAFVYLTVASAGLAQSYYVKSQEYALTSQRLSNQLLKAELHALKSQLNPHFLFNTLNTISGLVRLDQKSGAVKALSELSQMFRSVLENQNKQLTSLSNEMEFIDCYLAIQKRRFESKISLEVDVAKECLDAQLPFMLLHTLVENAVQHGSQLESNDNMMKLVVSLRDGNLHIRLVNKASTGDDHKGFGIGLQNCRKRLHHIYKDQYVLQSHEIEDGYFETLLSLPAGGANV
ncbi:sensor histidine kinase [uncultured Paraglaciecola sp.]|uniref:sensor histidine kinase n=1 Tax=uncultured Paraglaciecola sp. TaxID=1765024 RepID=UPI002607EFBB|nr:histidine kinase [uncultured Paraglaciecola sp.]